MAQRVLVNNIWLRRISNQILSGNRAKASSQADYLRSANIPEGRELYNPKLLKKNYGIIPLLLIVAGGITVLSGFIFRNAMTRDDVRFWKHGKFGYQEDENFDRQRKFKAYNQQYKAPEGLKELYEELKQE